MRYLIADPDPVRRSRIVARLPARAALEAASLTEAFHVSEEHRPDAIALSADITGDNGTGHVPSSDRRALDRASRLWRPRVGSHAGKAPEVDSLRSSSSRRRSRKASRRIPATLGPRRDASAGGTSDALGRRVGVEGAFAHRPWCIHRRRQRAGNGADGVSCRLPSDVVVQHIRAGFRGWHDPAPGRSVPCTRVIPAEDALRPQPGHVYIAHDPRNTLSCNPVSRRLRLKEAAPRHGHRPSVDALFESSQAGAGSRPPC
jgi:hypothetical protein